LLASSDHLKCFCYVQRFAYGLWRFRSTFLSTETKAGYGAKTLLAAVHPP
jgi:hypothetical protein